jgi:hypothetical protein
MGSRIQDAICWRAQNRVSGDRNKTLLERYYLGEREYPGSNNVVGILA